MVVLNISFSLSSTNSFASFDSFSLAVAKILLASIRVLSVYKSTTPKLLLLPFVYSRQKIIR